VEGVAEKATEKAMCRIAFLYVPPFGIKKFGGNACKVC
jgi:hypothetical protein